MGIEAFGIDRASRFATEHPGLRLKFKPRVKSPAPAGLFFTFRRRRTLCLQSTALDLVEVGRRFVCGDQSGRTSAPTSPQAVQTILGHKERTGISSGGAGALGGGLLGAAATSSRAE